MRTKKEVRNEEIRRKTGLRKLELIIKERRLRWLGHVLRMEDSRIPSTSGYTVRTEGLRPTQGKIGWTSSDKIRMHGHHLG